MSDTAAAPAPVADAPPPETDAEPAAAAVEGAAAEPAKEEPASDPALTSRFAKLAAEEKRLREQRKQAKEDAEAAKAWRELQAAKTGGKRIEVLKKLFAEDEIGESLYHELTDWVLENAKEISPEEKVSRQVQAEIDRREKERENERRAAEEKAAVERAQELQREWIREANEAVWDVPDEIRTPESRAKFKELGLNPYSVDGLQEMALIHWEQTGGKSGGVLLRPAEIVQRLAEFTKSKTTAAKPPIDGGDKGKTQGDPIRAGLESLNSRRRSVSVVKPPDERKISSRDALEELKRKHGLTAS